MARTSYRKYTYSLSNKTSQQVMDFLQAHESDSFPDIMEFLVSDHYALEAIKNGAEPKKAIAKARSSAPNLAGEDTMAPSSEDQIDELKASMEDLIREEEETTRKGIARMYSGIAKKMDAMSERQEKQLEEHGEQLKQQGEQLLFNQPAPPTVSPDTPKIEEILSILRSFEIDGIKAKNVSEIGSAVRSDSSETIDETNFDLVEAILGNDEGIMKSRPVDTESVRAAVSKVGDDTPFDGKGDDAAIADAMATAESTADLDGDDVDFSGFDFNQEPDEETKKSVAAALEEADERREIASGKYDSDLKSILG